MGARAGEQMSLDQLPTSLRADVAAIAQLDSVPALLDVLCRQTGMGFAAVARVTDESWTACAVLDKIGFGLTPGSQLPIDTTLCKESRQALRPIVIDDATLDPVYCGHHTPRIYGIRSYVSVPIVLHGDKYFGNLCAIDPNPAPVANPSTIAMFTSFADLIARQLEMEGRLATARTDLIDARAATDLREQFIAVLSHDLRTPLSSVVSIAHLMVQHGAKIEAHELGQRLMRSSRRMSELIDNVLDFTRARLGAGIGVVRALHTDLQQALYDVLSELRSAHPWREIISDIVIPVPVFCDQGRLQQLLSNLASNALQHGAQEQPIHVAALVHDGMLSLSVTNQGNPIAAENLAKIFQPYWRPAQAPETRGGLGLGLHICSQIVAAHGGTLTVTSSAESGSRFTAMIPTGAPGP